MKLLEKTYSEMLCDRLSCFGETMSDDEMIQRDVCCASA